MNSILIVGAGFAGAVHARELADAGYNVEVIDRRSHIAGNAFDEVTPEGIRVHRYGPHLFHTNNSKVIDWLSKFGEFVAYEHRVEALLSDNRLVPLPVNRKTINSVFGTDFQNADQIKNFLRQVSIPIDTPRNAAEFLYSNIGETLTNLFFRPYTKKMWSLDLEDLSAEVVKRIPIRFDDENRYFPSDQYQLMPKLGYTNLFESIFDHRRIKVSLDTEFDHGMVSAHAHCFNSMAIDQYFDFQFGPLPYRSIKFHHAIVDSNTSQPGYGATINFTDDQAYTRRTHWDRIPGHIVQEQGLRIVTTEEPCDYVDNDFERYYPVKTSDNRFGEIYKRYKNLSEQLPNITFIGRCGTYQYLDMHQVINQSLISATNWIADKK